MTSLAVLEPPLRRLFERIDFAPQPRSERLKAILDLWTAKRRGHIAPSPEATEAAWSGKGAFHFAYDASKHKYELAEGAESVRPLLGELKRGQDLATSGSRRAAVSPATLIRRGAWRRRAHSCRVHRCSLRSVHRDSDCSAVYRRPACQLHAGCLGHAAVGRPHASSGAPQRRPRRTLAVCSFRQLPTRFPDGRLFGHPALAPRISQIRGWRAQGEASYQRQGPRCLRAGWALGRG